jgi:hypothetical protein
MWTNSNCPSLLTGMQSGTATLGDSLAASYKTNIQLPYNLAVVLPGIFPKKLKTYLKARKITAALFITAKTLKHSKNLSVCKWIKCGTFR